MKDWKKVKLGSLLKESKVIAESPNTENRIRVKLNVLGVEKRPNTKDKKGATKYYIRKAGQFVYGRQNLHKGAFGIIPKELDNFESSQDIPAFDVDNSCYPEWIFYFFKKNNFYLKLESLAKGVGSKRINPIQIFQLDIYLPTKEEQWKIISEIKKIEIKNQELLKEIEIQEINLTKLQKSILQDAIQGTLTKDWREQNLDIEPAGNLLKKIYNDKEKLIKENKIKKDKPLPPISKEEFSFIIPSSWSFCRLGEIISLKSGQDLKPNEYSDTERIGLPYITGASNLQNEKVIINRWTNVPKSIAYKGDLLLTCKGSGVGKMGWLKEESAHIARQIMSIQTIGSSIKYVKIILDLNATYFKNNATGLIPGIDRKTVLETIVPFPPLLEQDVIIERIEKLQIYCSKIEQEIISNRKKSEELIQSVLGDLLGDENNFITNQKLIEKLDESSSREIKYNSKITFMDLVKLLKENGKMHAEDLWKMSKFPDDIDAFYAELKKQIEVEKNIKESSEKGYVELI